MSKKSSRPAVDASQFFEVPDPAQSAKERRLARQSEKVSQTVTPPSAPVRSAKERRMARQKVKDKAPKKVAKKGPKKPKVAKKPAKQKAKVRGAKEKGQESTQNRVGASPRSDSDKSAPCYWERTFCVCYNDGVWETYCDGKLVMKEPVPWAKEA